MSLFGGTSSIVCSHLLFSIVIRGFDRLPERKNVLNTIINVTNIVGVRCFLIFFTYMSNSNDVTDKCD